MKTHNIYIADLAITTSVEFEGSMRDYIFGPGVKTIAACKSLKYVLVRQKINTYGKIEFKDFKTKEKYSLKLPTSSGKIFINTDKIYPFSSFYPDVKENLPKRKILKMGNDAISRIIKTENKQKNK